jgi:2-desacetyl-2-hydroxyethyl bacteriochlorophyllide A dehydrogenase
MSVSARPTEGPGWSAVATTMRVIELPDVGKPLRLAERPVPEPGPGEARVRIQACGVCGSDVFLQEGGFGPGIAMPVVPGHEAAGVVEAVGPGVTDVNCGEQVAVYYIDAPPDSPYARQGRPNIGPGIVRMGVDVDGGFAEYVVRPTSTLIRVPAPIDPPALAVLTDAVATPYHALAKIARLQPGETLAVLGVGGLGTNAVQLGKYLGARVVAISRREQSLELALRLGADEVVQAGGDDTVARARAVCGGDGPDVVIQCAGSAVVDEQAIALATFGGRVVLVGASPEPFRVRAVELCWKELTLLGSRGFTAADIAEVIDLYLAGVLVTEHLTAGTRPLEEANEALEDLRAGRVLRSVLLP